MVVEKRVFIRRVLAVEEGAVGGFLTTAIVDSIVRRRLGNNALISCLSHHFSVHVPFRCS